MLIIRIINDPGDVVASFNGPRAKRRDKSAGRVLRHDNKVFPGAITMGGLSRVIRIGYQFQLIHSTTF